MLLSLNIENIAVIERASIEFGSGFTVMTGETGAGKSILIDSINTVLGGRVSRDLIRTGAEKASVSALFDHCPEDILNELSDQGFSVEDGTVLLSRTLQPDGRSISRINGAPATAAMIRFVAARLIDIHGQQDNHSLINTDNHVRYLDQMSGLTESAREYAKAFEHLRELKKELADSAFDEAEKAQKMDLLSFQIRELQDAEIVPGEREKLESKREMIRNSEKIASVLQRADAALSGDGTDDGMCSLCGSISSELIKSSDYFPELSKDADQLENISYELEAVRDSLRSAAENLEFDPDALEDIEARLDRLYRLSKKYGHSEEEMLAFLDRAQEKYDALLHQEQKLSDLQAQCDRQQKVTEELADALSAARKKAARQFELAVCAELAGLDMPSVRFAVSFTECSLYEQGREKIEFLISPNIGEPPKPLTKIASGGELSRIMLSIKSVLSDCDDISTMIFDEIDAGISGRAADKVGKRMKRLAQNRQVICVTHLAQIAACGDHHLLISKSERNGRTFTTVEEPDIQGRIREIARIMSGAHITDTTLRSAEELIENANRVS